MRQPNKREKGFTLIETLVALGIAAVALGALAERLGVSADTQRTLIAHSTMLETAVNILEQQRVGGVVDLSERNGDVTARGMNLHWELSSEKVMSLERFKRQNVVVSFKGEPDVKLFLYHRL